jgi:hypothetical protein
MDDDLTRHVERAVLGALLSGAAPGHADGLHAGDFTDPVHQAIFTAITDPDVAGSGLRGTLRRLLARLRTGGIRAHETYMAQLPQACPDAGHLASYVQILLTARQRRAAETRPEATSADAALASATDWLTASSRTPARDLARAGAATGPPKEVTRLATALSGAASTMTTAAKPAATREPAPRDTQQPLTRQRVEELVLADLMTRPADGREVIGWLPGDAFTTPETTQLFELISGLLGNGSPVDPVIVAWEASELARTAAAHGRPVPVSSDYVLTVAALATPPGTAPVLGRGLFADRVCSVKLGPQWVTRPGLTRIPSPPDPGPAPAADPHPSIAARKEPTLLPADSPAPAERTAPPVLRQPKPEPASPAPVPRA